MRIIILTTWFLVTVFFSNPEKQSPLLSFNYDLQLQETELVRDNITGTFQLKFSIYNSGLKTADNFGLQIFIETGKDSVYNPEIDQLLLCRDFKLLNSKQKITDSLVVSHIGKGTKKIVVFVNFKEDMNEQNNKCILFLTPSLARGSVVVSEIMFDPGSFFKEYIEIYNSTQDTINLINWKLADKYLTSGKRNEIKINEELILFPFSYYTLSADSTLTNFFTYLKNENNFYAFNRSTLNLNNDEDDVILIDPNGNIQDSDRYFSYWHNKNLSDTKGVSLERISVRNGSNDQNNWKSCSNSSGGTPSKINSSSAGYFNQGSLTITPNPFSPDDDGFEDVTRIFLPSSGETDIFRLRIFDKRGRLCKNLSISHFLINSEGIEWDGKDENNNILPNGIYIIFLELIDDSRGILKTIKSSVVIGKKH